MTCAVLIPEGYIALGKLAQALIHGARVLADSGQLRCCPGHRAPARRLGPGDGGQLDQPVPHRRPEDRGVRDRGRTRRRARRALHSGRQRRQHHCLLEGLPRVSGRRSGARSCPGCSGFRPPGRRRSSLGHPIDDPETVATAIRIGRPASWYGATAAAVESGGGIDSVTDDEILAAYRYLAQEESVFCEPASAASVAGLLKMGVPPGSTVVCVLTGHGLKDPDIAIGQIAVPTAVDADMGACVPSSGSDAGRAPRRRAWHRPGPGPEEPESLLLLAAGSGWLRPWGLAGRGGCLSAARDRYHGGVVVGPATDGASEPDDWPERAPAEPPVDLAGVTRVLADAFIHYSSTTKTR